MSLSLIRIVNISSFETVLYRALRMLPGVQYEETTPEKSAAALREGECDLALISPSEYLRHGGYNLLPYGVIANGAHVPLVIYAPADDFSPHEVFIRRPSIMAADLLELLLGELSWAFKGRVKIGIEEGPSSAAATLPPVSEALISPPGVELLNIAQAWRRHAGLPLPLAVWAVRTEIVPADFTALITECIERGCSHLETFAREWADQCGVERERAVRCLTQEYYFRLDRTALRALERLAQGGRRQKRLPVPVTVEAQGPARIDSLLEGASERLRLSIHDALLLAHQAPLLDLLHAAAVVVERNPIEGTATQLLDVPLVSALGESTAVVLSGQEIVHRVQSIPLHEHFQLTLSDTAHPEIHLGFLLDLLRLIKSALHCVQTTLSPDEVHRFARCENRPVADILDALKAAGLDILGESAGPLLLEHRRRDTSFSKPQEWLHIRAVAADHGLPSQCAITLDARDSWEERILHLLVIRDLHDQISCCQNVVCSGPAVHQDGASDNVGNYLRLVALTRLFLDNVPWVIASPSVFGSPIGEVALACGASNTLLRL